MFVTGNDREQFWVLSTLKSKICQNGIEVLFYTISYMGVGKIRMLWCASSMRVAHKSVRWIVSTERTTYVALKSCVNLNRLIRRRTNVMAVLVTLCSCDSATKPLTHFALHLIYAGVNRCIRYNPCSYYYR